MDYMTDGKTVEIRTEDGRVVVGPGALELISSWEWLQEANRNARRGIGGEEQNDPALPFG